MRPSVFGSFGVQPDDVLATEFFAFFHLTETGRSDLPDGKTSIAYRSPAPMFHDLTWVEVVVDRQGILRMTLSLLDRFITASDKAVYARDIAKSFIGNGAANSEDIEAVKQIMYDISYRPIEGSSESSPIPSDPNELMNMLAKQLDLGRKIAVTMGNPAEKKPDLPDVYSRGYAVYLGERVSFTTDLSMTRFSMRNETLNGERLLVVAFDRSS